jgi:hypothetical protein
LEGCGDCGVVCGQQLCDGLFVNEVENEEE